MYTRDVRGVDGGGVDLTGGGQGGCLGTKLKDPLLPVSLFWRGRKLQKHPCRLAHDTHVYNHGSAPELQGAQDCEKLGWGLLV